MMNSKSVASSPARRFEQLAELYRQEIAGPMLEGMLNKLFRYEAEICQAQLDQLWKDLAEFEGRYNMPSANFYQLFQSGKTDDRMDYIEWASLIQMAERLKMRLNLLIMGKKNDDSGIS